MAKRQANGATNSLDTKFEIDTTECCKYLGVILDNNMFSTQCMLKAKFLRVWALCINLLCGIMGQYIKVHLDPLLIYPKKI